MQEIRAGDTVRLKRNAVSYNGRIISSRLKSREWTVEKAEGDRLWLEVMTANPQKRARLTVNVKYVAARKEGIGQ